MKYLENLTAALGLHLCLGSLLPVRLTESEMGRDVWRSLSNTLLRIRLTPRLREVAQGLARMRSKYSGSGTKFAEKEFPIPPLGD